MVIFKLCESRGTRFSLFFGCRWSLWICLWSYWVYFLILFNLFMNFWAWFGFFLVCFGLLGYTCGHFASVCFVSFCRWYLKIFFYDFAPGLPAVSLAALVPPRLIKPGIMRSPTSSADLFNIPSIILTSHPSLTLAWGMQGPIRPKVPLALPSPLPPFLSHAFFIVLYS